MASVANRHIYGAGGGYSFGDLFPGAEHGGGRRVDSGGCLSYSCLIMRPVTLHALPVLSAFAPAADVRLAPRHEVLLDI